jgi:hypothetical protein
MDCRAKSFAFARIGSTLCVFSLNLDAEPVGKKRIDGDENEYDPENGKEETDDEANRKLFVDAEPVGKKRIDGDENEYDPENGKEETDDEANLKLFVDEELRLVYVDDHEW